MKKSLLTAFLIAMMVCGLAFADSVHSASVSPSIVSASNSVSIVPSITWSRTYVGSNLGSVVIQTADGGFLLGSATLPNLGNNVELLKVDSLGNPQWNKT